MLLFLKKCVQERCMLKRLLYLFLLPKRLYTNDILVCTKRYKLILICFIDDVNDDGDDDGLFSNHYHRNQHHQ